MEIKNETVLKSELEKVLKKDGILLFNLVNEINQASNSLMNLNFIENHIYDFDENFQTKEDLWFALRNGDYNFDDEYIQINQNKNIDSYSFVEAIKMMQDNINDILDKYIENYIYMYRFKKLDKIIYNYLKNKSIEDRKFSLVTLSLADFNSDENIKKLSEYKDIVIDFSELDNIMNNGKYYYIHSDKEDDYALQSMKNDRELIYTNKITGVAELRISFDIVYDNAEDESIDCFSLKILNVEKI